MSQIFPVHGVFGFSALASLGRDRLLNAFREYLSLLRRCNINAILIHQPKHLGPSRGVNGGLVTLEQWTFVKSTDPLLLDGVISALVEEFSGGAVRFYGGLLRITDGLDGGAVRTRGFDPDRAEDIDLLLAEARICAQIAGEINSPWTLMLDEVSPRTLVLDAGHGGSGETIRPFDAFLEVRRRVAPLGINLGGEAWFRDLDRNPTRAESQIMLGQDINWIPQMGRAGHLMNIENQIGPIDMTAAKDAWVYVDGASAGVLAPAANGKPSWASRWKEQGFGIAAGASSTIEPVARLMGLMT